MEVSDASIDQRDHREGREMKACLYRTKGLKSYDEESDRNAFERSGVPGGRLRSSYFCALDCPFSEVLLRRCMAH